MTGLRELEEKMDQYDQDRKRLQFLLASARDQVTATEEENARVEASKWGMVELCSEKDRTIRKLQSEIDRYKVEAKLVGDGQEGAFMVGWRYGRGSDSDDCPVVRCAKDWDEFLTTKDNLRNSDPEGG